MKFYENLTHLQNATFPCACAFKRLFLIIWLSCHSHDLQDFALSEYKLVSNNNVTLLFCSR